MNPDQAIHMDGDIKTLCQKYMNYHVIAQTKDGSQFEGIIEGMDGDGVTMLVPEEVDGEERDNDPSRQPFGYGRRRYRRFRRQRFPFFYFAFPFFRP
jgi:small nuclear ribonucleoprotein (snRNP)-like protein